MRILILLYIIVLTSISCKSQELVSAAFLDSIHNVEKSHIGKHFANFNAIDMTGNHWSDSILHGKITFINFWFKDCAPCVAEFESLNRVYQKFKDNTHFNFFSFTFEDSSVINQLTQKYSLQFPVIPVSRQQCYRLNFNSGFPTNIIVNQKGAIVFFKSGGATEEKNATIEMDTTMVPKLKELLESLR